MELNDLESRLPACCMLAGRLFAGTAAALCRLEGLCLAGCRTVIMVNSGRLDILVDGRGYTLGPAAVADVPEVSSLTVAAVSLGADVACLIASSGFMADTMKNIKIAPDGYILDRLRNPLVSLDDGARRLARAFGLISRCLADVGHHFREDLAMVCFKGFMLEFGDILLAGGAAGGAGHIFGRRDTVALEFIRLANEYACREHAIGFYADRLCVSSKHLGRIVSGVTGKTPCAVIRDVLLREAMLHLEHDCLPVSVIASRLGFADQSSLCKFFKRQTGMSPMEYRKRMGQGDG